MTHRSLSMLIVLNAVLLAALSVTLFSTPASAQFGGGAAYTMIAGQVTGRADQESVYIIDLNTSRMVAVIFNTNNNRADVIDGRVVADDAQRPMGGSR